MAKSKKCDDPVSYCIDCLSLNIKQIGEGNNSICYCDKCGCANIKECDISEWEKLFKEKYGYEYLKGKPKETTDEDILTNYYNKKYGIKDSKK